ncbi:MAG: hypothetical protein ABJE66_10315 [Deltaproteobacteria bacterium]
MAARHDLTADERDRVVTVICRWIARELERR